MKFLTIVLILAITISTYAQNDIEVSLKYFKEQYGVFQPQNFNYKDMVSSLYEALQNYLADPSVTGQCREDVTQILKFADNLQQNLENFNIMSLGLNAKVLYNQVQNAIKDCHSSETNTPLLKQMKPVLEIPEYNPIKCLQDIKKLEILAQKIEEDLKTFNLTQLAADIKEAEALIAAASEDCNKNETIYEISQKVVEEFVSIVQYNPIKCLQEIAQLKALVTEIEEDLKTFNLTKLAADVQKATDLLAQANVDCNKETEAEQTNEQIKFAEYMVTIESNLQETIEFVDNQDYENAVTPAFQFLMKQFQIDYEQYGDKCVEASESLKKHSEKYVKKIKNMKLLKVSNLQEKVIVDLERVQELCQ